jgi:hypothetical protein
MKKKFFSKLILLSCLVFGLSLCIKFFIYQPMQLVPATWGSERLYHKTQYLKQHKEINTIFIGASQVLLHINPKEFDTIVSPQLHTQSFNLGENWFSASELFYVLDNIIEKDSLSFKYVFVELSKIKRPDLLNLNKTRVFYWYDWERYKFTITAAWNSRYSIVYRGATIASHTLGYIDNLINLSFLSEAIKFNEITKSNSPDFFLGPYRNGYLIPNFNPSVKVENLLNDFKQQPNHFLKDSSVIVSKRKISEIEFAKFDTLQIKNISYNKFYLKQINLMIDKYQRKGIKLIFFLAIRLDRNHYEEVLPLFKGIPVENKFEISDARKYPDLYAARYSYDITHLNPEGAKIYTSLLAQKFLEKKILHSDK